VKVRGYDVMLTEKIVFCIVMVPTLWVFYAFVLWFGTNMSGPAITLTIASMPLFAYSGIVVSEAGIVEWKDLRPYLLRLLPSTRHRLLTLPATRQALREDLRLYIRTIGPELGEIYYQQDLDWAAIHQHTAEKFKGEDDHKKVD
jgi:glycerol-3-phosphate O-acyltransferase / dihydroxyacetone phosphate acyltransferase